MIALFRTTAAFFIAVLLVFLLISSLVDREHKPDFPSEIVLQEFQTQLDKVRSAAKTYISTKEPAKEIFIGTDIMPGVLLYEVSGTTSPIIRAVSPMLARADNWSLSPIPGGDPPEVTMALFTLEREDTKQEIHSYVVTENIFDSRGDPYVLTTYIQARSKTP